MLLLPLSFFQVPRVLHPWLVYCGQKRDVSLLPRKGRSQANVPEPVGEAAHDVRSAFGLVAVVGLLATHHSGSRPRNQLGPGSRVVPSSSAHKSTFLAANI